MEMATNPMPGATPGTRIRTQALLGRRMYALEHGNVIAIKMPPEQ